MFGGVGGGVGEAAVVWLIRVGMNTAIKLFLLRYIVIS